jgi:hypothetical protein
MESPLFTPTLSVCSYVRTSRQADNYIRVLHAVVYKRTNAMHRLSRRWIRDSSGRPISTPPSHYAPTAVESKQVSGPAGSWKPIHPLIPTVLELGSGDHGGVQHPLTPDMRRARERGAVQECSVYSLLLCPDSKPGNQTVRGILQTTNNQTTPMETKQAAQNKAFQECFGASDGTRQSSHYIQYIHTGPKILGIDSSPHADRVPIDEVRRPGVPEPGRRRRSPQNLKATSSAAVFSASEIFRSHKDISRLAARSCRALRRRLTHWRRRESPSHESPQRAANG